MAGVQSSAIDFAWIMANLEVRRVNIGQDEAKLKELETLVVGQKATLAAEAYVLGLFHLYPTVYFHKTTRGAEKLLTALLSRTFQLVIDGSVAKTSGIHLCATSERPTISTFSVIWTTRWYGERCHFLPKLKTNVSLS